MKSMLKVLIDCIDTYDDDQMYYSKDTPKKDIDKSDSLQQKDLENLKIFLIPCPK